MWNFIIFENKDNHEEEISLNIILHIPKNNLKLSMTAIKKSNTISSTNVPPTSGKGSTIAENNKICQVNITTINKTMKNAGHFFI